LIGNKAKRALTVFFAPMLYAKGLGTTFQDGASKEARMALLTEVVKGYNVLQLRDAFDAYATSSPDEMEKLDRSLVGVFLTSDQVLSDSSQSLPRCAATNKLLFRRNPGKYFAPD